MISAFQIHSNISIEDIMTMIESGDTNTDGFIDFGEFGKLMKN